MRTAVTVGFAVEEADRPRLDHLADVFGAGSRSSFLRAAMTAMEHVEQVGRLERVQSYGAARLAAAGYTIEDVPDIVERALREPDLEATAQAALVHAARHRRPTAVVQGSEGGDDQVDASPAVRSATASTRAAVDVPSLVAGFSQPSQSTVDSHRAPSTSGAVSEGVPAGSPDRGEAAFQVIPDDVVHQLVLVLAGRELRWRIDEVELAVDAIQQLARA